jgi:hypothetical protein
MSRERHSARAGPFLSTCCSEFSSGASLRLTRRCASLIGMKYKTPISTPSKSQLWTPSAGAGLPPIPLRPDPGAVREAALRSLVRAVLATGLNGLNPASARPTTPSRRGIYDRDVPLLLRAAVCPTSLADSPLRHLSHGPIRRLWSMSAYWRAHPRGDPVGHF